MSAESKMSSMTLDELLARAGVTRDEWKRARVVVEDYWKEYAEMHGWGPLDEPSPRRVFTFPLGGGHTFSVSAPLSPEQWSVLMEVLQASKRGLVLDSNQDSESA